MHLDPVFLGTPRPSSCPEQLTLSTQNVWFDKLHREERNALLLELLSSYRPHLMAFQEVTLPFVRALQSCQWLRDEGYWVSAIEHQWLGAVMVGRVPLRELYFLPLESTMGRRLLVARLEGGPTVATAHFESTSSAGPVRARQFEQTFEHLSQESALVVMGDFNSQSHDPECRIIPDDVVDCWQSLHPDEPGYTMDSTLNTLLAQTARGKVQERIDRMLLRGRIRAHKIELLGTKPSATGLFASDHFGLVANLQHGR